MSVYPWWTGWVGGGYVTVQNGNEGYNRRKFWTTPPYRTHECLFSRVAVSIRAPFVMSVKRTGLQQHRHGKEIETEKEKEEEREEGEVVWHCWSTRKCSVIR